MEPYIRIASMLVDVGVNAPRVIERNDEEGFLLNSDLGSQHVPDASSTRGATPIVCTTTPSTRWCASSRAAAAHAAALAAVRRRVAAAGDGAVSRVVLRPASRPDAVGDDEAAALRGRVRRR